MKVYRWLCARGIAEVSGRGDKHKPFHEGGSLLQLERDAGKDTSGKEEGNRGMQSSATTGSAEASLQHVKCYNCHKKGHVKANCPEPKKNTPRSNSCSATDN